VTRWELGLVLLLIVMASCFSSAQTPSDSHTGIEGVITIAPIHPGPVREGVSSSAPLSNVVFTVANEKRTVTSFTTDAQGRFSISLAPSRYQVSQNGKTGIRKCGPFEVEVLVGKMTTVEWQCDTGMR
jgi:hypothetical protein